MSLRSVPLALSGVGVLWWLFFLVSDVSLFADIGTVCIGVALVIGALSIGADATFGFVEGIAGAYGGAVALLAYRLLAAPHTDLGAWRVATELRYWTVRPAFSSPRRPSV